MEDDTDTMQIGADSGDGSDGAGDSADWDTSGNDGSYSDQGDDGSYDDEGDDGDYTADQGDGGADDSANFGPTDGTDAGYDGAYGSANGTAGGGWGSFDPSVATDSVMGGLGDVGSGLWHAAGHVAKGAYDFGASTVHGVEAAADAFWGDREGTNHRMDQAKADAADMRSQLHQAGQDLWGN
jgi:hypothetical protein